MTDGEKGGQIVDVKPELGVYKAITAAIKLLKTQGITKDRQNQQQGYKFRGIDDVFNAVAPVLAEVGLCILPEYSDRTITERRTEKGGTLFTVVIRGDFVFISASDGSRCVVTTYGEAMDIGDKATNKAMSAAYKYAVIQTFAIPTEGDNDADFTTQPAVTWAEGKKAAAAVADKKIATMSALPGKNPPPVEKSTGKEAPLITACQTKDEFLLALSVLLTHFPKLTKEQRKAQWQLAAIALSKLTGNSKEYQSVLANYGLPPDRKGELHASDFDITPKDLRMEMAAFEEMWKVWWDITAAQVSEYRG